ncbi:hypothetical protein LCGC14_1057900 [marine sediment metagenome]|uniref:Phage protein Gp37/Gp68 n=1 Tax=marine sediment metagenome TaxID=412755 RepID=A0A0F9N8W6_9ZZZZ
MSKIEWLARPGTTPRSWNPITGCTRVSPGCENCYAETMSHRLNAMGQPKYQGVTKPSGKWSTNVYFHQKELCTPRLWKKPSTIFVCSMSDLFHEGVQGEALDKIFDAMEDHYRHTYLILTKRPERMRDYLSKRWTGAFQPQFIWAGTSVEDQERADERIPLLLQVPAAVRFLSVEPLLGPVDFGWPKPTEVEAPEYATREYFHGPDWVIAGGESGPGARPCNIDWLQNIRDQCYEASVPFFMKQLGSLPVEPDYDSTNPDDTAPIEDGHGRSKRSDPAILEAHGLNIREWPG